MVKYGLADIHKAIRNPRLAASEFVRLSSSGLYHLNDLFFHLRYSDGQKVINKDWDVLIILDALRYDYFNQINTIPGESDSTLSLGSNSKEFIQRNFVGEDLHDTVYVTANPHAVRMIDSEFHALISLLDEWNNELETVPPKNVTSAAIAANEKYPTKRLIIHYMQPHSPHIGKTAERIKEKINISGWSGGVNKLEEQKSGQAIWEYVKSGKVPHSDLHKAYSESVDIVLTHAEEIVEQVHGKTVITADHGEMLGERAFPISPRLYEHPSIATPELRIVPWFVTTPDQERTIKSEKPDDYVTENKEVVDSRLTALGYKS